MLDKAPECGIVLNANELHLHLRPYAGQSRTYTAAAPASVLRPATDRGNIASIYVNASEHFHNRINWPDTACTAHREVYGRQWKRKIWKRAGNRIKPE